MGDWTRPDQVEQASESLLEKGKEVEKLLLEHSLRIFWISLECVIMSVFLLPVLFCPDLYHSLPSAFRIWVCCRNLQMHHCSVTLFLERCEQTFPHPRWRTRKQTIDQNLTCWTNELFWIYLQELEWGVINSKNDSDSNCITKAHKSLGDSFQNLGTWPLYTRPQ